MRSSSVDAYSRLTAIELCARVAADPHGEILLQSAGAGRSQD